MKTIFVSLSNSNFTALISGLKKVKFKELPKEYKLSLRQRWKEHHDLSGKEKEIDKLDVLYGEIPTDKFLKILKKYPFYKDDFETFEAWLEWRLSGNDVPDHGNSRWPCILTTWNEEPLDDGWHRLSYYLKSKAKTIPVVYCLNTDSVFWD